MAKYYIDSHNPPAKVAKGITVFYGNKEHELYSNLVLSDSIELQHVKNTNPYIELSYPIDDRVVFLLRDNLLHFIIISENNLPVANDSAEISVHLPGKVQSRNFRLVTQMPGANKTESLIKTESVKYPWHSSFNGIRVSIMTEDEYKENWLINPQFCIG
uniref:Uncharacterized protein n=1 Tax=viral metagenome TaxID=1070528 RepID=A0A6C0ANB6_9ZZZZ